MKKTFYYVCASVVAFSALYLGSRGCEAIEEKRMEASDAIRYVAENNGNIGVGVGGLVGLASGGTVLVIDRAKRKKRSSNNSSNIGRVNNMYPELRGFDPRNIKKKGSF